MGGSLDSRLAQNDTLRIMDIFANVPPLFDDGQDLYRVLTPSDAMNWHSEAFPVYNPGISRAVRLLHRALAILRSAPQ
jgi:hypothetical protein